MRRLIGTAALAAALTLLIVVPAVAQGGQDDGARFGGQLEERVGEQNRERAGIAVQEGDEVRLGDRANTQIQDRDGDCDGALLGDCTGDQSQTHLRDRDRERDCTFCDGDGPGFEQRMWHRWWWSVYSAI